MTGDVLHMAAMGVESSVLAPLLVLAGRRGRAWRRIVVPAGIALPLFLVAHLAITSVMAVREFPYAVDALLHTALLVAAMAFWLPVLGGRSRLSEPAKMACLYLAMPVMDLAGVFVVIHGDGTGGLAMIVAMLPVGVVAVARTWRWIVAEEAAASRGSVVQRQPDRSGERCDADEQPGDVVPDMPGVQPA